MTSSSTQNKNSEDLTLDQMMNDYRDIALMLNALWPIESEAERVFARTLKLTEEIGELSNEILTKMGLQRQAKVDAFQEHHLEDELADVLGSVLLLAVELDIDIKAIMQKKIAFTIERLQQELEDGE
jgi:NTP pyrophosphatase (non-canonical NTP hydrolase)